MENDNVKKYIYVGGYGACAVDNEKYIVKLFASELEKKGFYFTDDYKEADDIVLTDTCFALMENVELFFDCLYTIKNHKKENANIIISGCAARKIKSKFNRDLKKNNPFINELFEDTITVDKDDLYGFFINRYFNTDEVRYVYDKFIPFTRENPYLIRISPVAGCLNNCSFCKVNYYNFDLKSVPFEYIEDFSKKATIFDQVHYLDIISSNFSLYGVDLYGKRRAHEVIHTLSQMDNIRYIHVGAIINWYPELLEEILNNNKIKSMAVAIETGSKSLYESMNRPIPLDKLEEVFTEIKTKRPDIIIKSDVISGYPEEKREDIIDTLEFVQKNNLYVRNCYPYKNGPYIPSSKLVQHSQDYINVSKRYYDRKTDIINDKFEEDIKKQGLLIVDEIDNIFVGLRIDGNLVNINKDYLTSDYTVGDIIYEDYKKNKVKTRGIYKKR